MRRFGKRVLGWGFMVMLLITIFPVGAWAGDKPAVSLEQAIRTVKDNFSIPGEFTNFTSGYNNYNGRATWSLNWNANDGKGGGFNAQVDAATGEIINMNMWQPVDRPEPGLQVPAFSQDEARQAAEKVFKRLAANHIADLQAVPDSDQVIPLNNYGPVTYSFRWQRLVNGIPFPENGVNINIRSDNGQVVNYSLDWTNADFPAATGAITPEKARQAFDKAGMLELQYYLPPQPGPVVAGQKRLPQLVYIINHPANGLIDALTGEPLVMDDGKWFKGGAGGMGELAEMHNGAASQTTKPLSPEEIKEIEKTAKLISQDAAIAAVKKWLAIPANLTLSSANLAVDWQDPETSIWNLSWNTSKPDPGQINYVTARVDATTGELVGFDLSYPSPDGKPGQLDRQGAQQMVEDFLRQVQPERFREVKLDANSRYGPGPIPLKSGQNQPVQYFNYRRLVNGIPFPENGISVTVDTVAKRITSYNLNWGQFDFPAQKNLLQTEKATEIFLKSRPLTLTYIQIFGSAGPGEVRLVYQPLAAPGTSAAAMVDARTGQLLDWQGTPLNQAPRPYHFNDIAGNFAKREINLLGQAGLFGEYGSAFHPDENITAVSLLRAMLMAKNGVQGNSDLGDDEVLKRAREQGWLKEDLQPGASITRETLAKLMIRLLNLDHVARVEGIYRVPYTDAGSLSSDSLGYVALSWGLGILKGNGSTFEPGHQVTRAEAAAALVRTLAVKPLKCS
ncbi:peptidase propeptide and YPEB domain protein [Moorella thermoacetica]|uniref:Peptidase propeptide and YPEB domain protein n=1 Tax=Neomoorella thermoacetica TaxID=1525 RepID=A0A1J5JHQ5_NEOTH|nr:peptidase propeptide and YPEB domain protein [Moorella thermoacetica]